MTESEDRQKIEEVSESFKSLSSEIFKSESVSMSSAKINNGVVQNDKQELKQTRTTKIKEG